MLILLSVLPLAFFVHRYWRGAKDDPLLLVAVAALLGTAVAWGIVAWAERARGATEIAWTAIERLQPHAALQIGGDEERSPMAWPNGHTLPQVTVDPSGSDCCKLTIGGGSAFLLRGNEPLNGAELNANGLDDRQYRIRPVDSWIWRSLEITESQSKNQVGIVRFRTPGRDTVMPLTSLLERSLAIAWRDSKAGKSVRGRAAEAHHLEQWGSEHWLLLRPGGKIYLLGLGEQSERVAPDTVFSLLWPGRRQVFTLRYQEGRAGLQFTAPWAASSALPAARDERTNLVVTGNPRPGDVAFLLPLRGLYADQRLDLQLTAQQLAAPAIGPHQPSALGPQPDALFRWSPAPSLVERVVDLGPMRLHLNVVRSRPTGLRFLPAFLIALVAFLLAQFVCTDADYFRTSGAASANLIWMVTGISLGFWSLLLWRLVLAVRYTLEPASLDSTSVAGVTNALAALTALPALLLIGALFTRLNSGLVRPPNEADRGALYRGLQIVGLATTVLTLLQYRLAPRYWPHLGSAFFPRISRLGLPAWLALAAVCALAVAIILFLVAGNTKGDLARVLRAVCFQWPCIFHRFATRTGPNIWKVTATTYGRSGAQLGRQYVRLASLLLGGILVLSALCLLTHLALPSSLKLVQEVIAPLILCWTAVCFLLSSRSLWTAGPTARMPQSFHWMRAIVLTTVVVGITLLLSPMSLKDTGGIMATSAVFLAALPVLFAGRGYAGVGRIGFGLVIAGAFGAFLLFLNLDPIVRLHAAPGESPVRMVVYQDWLTARSDLAWYSAIGNEGPNPLSANTVRAALEHTWENRAMAQQGGWFGLGYGNSPDRRSQIRLDTMQFDSAFSFYIASEHGLIGAVSLFLLYAFPLAIVAIGGGQRFHIGVGLACVVMTALFVEALIHCLMNYGVLAFTGRDLPLLAVNSFGGDLIRWFVLFSLALQAVQWQTNTGEYSMLSGKWTGAEAAAPANWWRLAALPLVGLLALAFAGVRNLNDPSLPNTYDWSPLFDEVRSLTHAGTLRWDPASHQIALKGDARFTGTSLLEQEILRFNALSDEEKREGLRVQRPRDFLMAFLPVATPAEYDEALRTLRNGGARNSANLRPSLFRLAGIPQPSARHPQMASLDEQLAIMPNPDYNAPVSFESAVHPKSRPLTSIAGGAAGSYVIQGRGFRFRVATGTRLPDYTVTLNEIDAGELTVVDPEKIPATSRIHVRMQYRPPNRSTVVTVELGRFDASGDTFTLTPSTDNLTRDSGFNPFNRHLDRGRAQSIAEGDRYRVNIKERDDTKFLFEIATDSGGALIGPAWVNGGTRTVVNKQSSLSWVRYLARALESEWRKQPEKAAAVYGKLTLAASLQESTQNFVRATGRSLHAELLANSVQARRNARPGSAEQIRLLYDTLPPRVAVTVLQLPNGQVRALGSWPSTSPDANWRQASTGGELLPPAEWLEHSAPAQFANLYLSDRNFDRIVLGSTTKPIVAAAALSVHPGLEHFAVRPSRSPENAVFGIVLPGADWPIYTVAAVERAYPRWYNLSAYLAGSHNGFQIRLGFLALAEGAAQVSTEEGASPSTVESMDDGAHEWRSFPRFPATLGFSREHSRSFNSLAETSFALRLRKIFGIGITRDERSYRRSFWTGDEHDDTSGALSRFDLISPQVANLEMNHIASPQEYVSLLLGGGSNLWSNVDFAAAFGTVVTGQTVLPRITAGSQQIPVDREAPLEVARMLRPGLREAVRIGTAAEIGACPGLGALRRNFPNLVAYAKTGTLATQRQTEDTSRIAIALVDWSDAAQTSVRNGLVLSFVKERGGVASALRMAVAYFDANSAALANILRSPAK